MCFRKNESSAISLAPNPKSENQVFQSDVMKNPPSLLSSFEEAKESKGKGFSKLHVAVQNLILNASAPNSEIKAASCSEECALFFKASSSANASLHFMKSMKHVYNTNCDVLQGVIEHLYRGHFLRDFNKSPSNFSPFSFPKKLVLCSRNADNNSLILVLK